MFNLASNNKTKMNTGGRVPGVFIVKAIAFQGAVLFSSSGAARKITGIMLPIDGGFSTFSGV